MSYLYHATSVNNLDSILSAGLSINPYNHNWGDMYVNGAIFLAFNARVALHYAMLAGIDDVVVLKVPYERLDETQFGYDWNNRCEYTEDINSCIYLKDIPADILEVVENIGAEPYQDIFTLENTYMGEVVLDTFDYEVETNIENEDSH